MRWGSLKSRAPLRFEKNRKQHRGSLPTGHTCALAACSHDVRASRRPPSARPRVDGQLREGGEDRRGDVRGGVQGPQPRHGRDRGAQKNPAGAGGGGRAVHRDSGDIASQGAQAREHRQVRTVPTNRAEPSRTPGNPSVRDRAFETPAEPTDRRFDTTHPSSTTAAPRRDFFATL